MSKKFKAMVLSCMDPRFQPLVFNYLNKKGLKGKYSAFTIAGAAVGVTHNKFKKWHTAFIANLATSIELHKIEKLRFYLRKILLNILTQYIKFQINMASVLNKFKSSMLICVRNDTN